MEDACEWPESPEEAVSILMEELGDWVLRLAYVHTKNLHAAEDIAQETFLRAYKGWRNYRHASSVRTWIGKITVNLCRDYFRRHAKEVGQSTIEQHPDLPTTVPTPEQSCLTGEEFTQIKRALEDLGDTDRTVLLMYYYFDLSTAEIAKIMGVREGTLRSRMTRARQKLKTILEVEDMS